MDSIRVLYVEDDPADRELTLHHLRQHAPGMEVQVVGTGREAREALRRERFDLVLLDYRLPDGDGLQLLREVLASSPDVPVVMVTGSGDHEVAVGALKLGAIDYVIKKPGHLDRLPAVVREALARFRHARSRRASGLRILCAEHDPADVDLTLRHLAAHAAHLEIEPASTGAAALRKLEAGGFDLLLLDYRMPDLDGLEILQELRERGIRIPVVMVTGHGDEETAVQALKLGAADYVVKREGYLTQLPYTIEIAIAHRALADEKEALLTLNGIAVAVASTLDLDEVLRKVSAAAATLLRVERSLVSLVSADGAELLAAAWYGGPAEVAARLRFRVGQDVPGRAAAERRPVSVADYRLAAPAVQREAAVLEGVGGVLSVPMLARERLLGVLTVAATGPRAFTRSEEALLAALAAHAAVGIENARLLALAQRHAAELGERVRERTRELEAANQQLQEASRHKSEFLANMSHELRTPLNSIIGFAEFLGQQTAGFLNPKQARYVGHIQQSGKHLLQLINDILDLSKVETGKFVLEPQALPVATTLEDILVIARGLAHQKAQSIELEIEPDLPPLQADPVRFKQILFNLLSNAVKFTPEQGQITLVARRASAGGELLELRVTDTGIGIKAEDLPRLFQEFVQLEAAATKRYEGTGLGLALTKRLVELHGGRISAASEGEGRGTTFTVVLPFQG
ncbi:MAG: response regulator [candidate division NC10 bacterium]|nr:response regulator [candidate division NC10 bacterium]